MATSKGKAKVEKLKSDGWIFCGGTKDKTDRYVFQQFKLNNDLGELKLKKKDKCQCGNEIIHQNYICIIDDDGNYRFRIIGSECIKKFYKDEYNEIRKYHRKKCPVCKTIHGNRKKTKLCYECCYERCERCYKYGIFDYKYCYNCKYN